ncbi:MAG: hypothetical protein DMG02_17345 [Acidobacteria bacterium]|nr:MAG: hypothetical protein DMG02_17345 [Acidobacteriota bacterium]
MMVRATMSPAETTTNRRERFRQYMNRLTTGATPMRAVTEGLYVPVPTGASAVAEKLTARLDLEPTSSHLVVGGIGTGKSTQLLVSVQRLRELPDSLPLYIDVASHHDLNHLKSGVLIVIAGLALSEYLAQQKTDVAKKAREEFRTAAQGYSLWVDDDEADYDDYGPSGRHFKVEGVLVPPDPPLDYTSAARLKSVKVLIEAAREVSSRHNVVLLMDSLDRAPNMDAFGTVIANDIRGLRELGLGVVVVGPLRVLFGANRPLTDRFDHTYYVSPVDVANEAGPSFLKQVLLRRIPKDILAPEAADSLTHYSGGVIRDMLSLARSAGEEAYVSGSNTIATDHVDRAVDAFGRSMMVGLDDAEMKTLQRVRKSGTFVSSSDKDIALLVTRRVLEYQNGRSRYDVHPTIAPLLESLADSK